MVRLRFVIMAVWPLASIALLDHGPRPHAPWWVVVPLVYAMLGLSYLSGWCFERALKADRW